MPSARFVTFSHKVCELLQIDSKHKEDLRLGALQSGGQYVESIT